MRVIPTQVPSCTSRASRLWLTLHADAVAVIAFVVVERRIRQESEVLLFSETAAPLLRALLAAWAIARA